MLFRLLICPSFSSSIILLFIIISIILYIVEVIDIGLLFENVYGPSWFLLIKIYLTRFYLYGKFVLLLAYLSINYAKFPVIGLRTLILHVLSLIYLFSSNSIFHLLNPFISSWWVFLSHRGFIDKLSVPKALSLLIFLMAYVISSGLNGV